MRHSSIALILGLAITIAQPAVGFAKSTPAPLKSGNSIDQMQNQAKQLEKNIEAQRARQEQLKKQQEELEKQIQALQDDMVQTASRAQEQEDALNKLEDSLKDLNQKSAAAEANIRKNHETLSYTLGALLRIKRQPPQSLMALPQTPLETAHTIVLLRHVWPELQKMVVELKVELDDIRQVQDRIAEKHDEVKNRTQQLAQEQTKLGKLVKRRIAAQTANKTEQEKLEAKIGKLADQAADMHDLIDKLEQERKARAQAQAKAAKPTRSRIPGKEVDNIAGVPLPAKGKILTNFGEKTELGTSSKGLVIETRSGAQIVSPYGGEVVYAGNFRSYGLILIIEVGDGYHIMLSNLGRIDAVLGKEVVAGEPVGTMPTTDPAPKLYVEFRKSGQPVSPQHWTSPNS